MTDENDPLGRKQVVKAAKQLLFLKGVFRGIQALRALILAALLGPEQFGVFAVALVTISTVQFFTEAGFEQTLLRTSRMTLALERTAWTMLITRSVGAGALIFLSAPLVANFFNEPRAVLVLQLIGLFQALSGFKNVAVVTQQRQLRFGPLLIVDATSALLDLTVTVAVAIFFESYWAMVAGYGAATLSRVAVSYMAVPRTVWPGWDRTIARELRGLGFWLWLSNVFIFVGTRGPIIVAGKVLGTPVLALLQISERLSNASIKELARIANKISMPMMGRASDNREGMVDVMLKAISATSFMSMGMVIVVSATLPLVCRFLKPGWEPITYIAPLLLVAGAVRSVCEIIANTFLTIGKTQLMVPRNATRAVVAIVGSIAGAHFFGVIGVAGALCFAVALMFFTDLALLREQNIGVGGVRLEVIKCAFVPVMSAGVAAIAVYASGHWQKVTSAPLVEQVAVLLGGVAIYMTLCVAGYLVRARYEAALILEIFNRSKKKARRLLASKGSRRGNG